LEHGSTHAEIGVRAVNEIIATTRAVVATAETAESASLKATIVESQSTFFGSLISGGKGRRIAKARRAYNDAHTRFGREHEILVTRCLSKVKTLLHECNELKKAFESVQMGFSKVLVGPLSSSSKSTHIRDDLGWRVQSPDPGSKRLACQRCDHETGIGIAGFGMIGVAGLAMIGGPLAIPALIALAGGTMVASATINDIGKCLFAHLSCGSWHQYYDRVGPNEKALDTQRFLGDLQEQIALAISTVAEQVKHWNSIRLLLEEAVNDMSILPSLPELRLSLQRWAEVKTNYLAYASQVRISSLVAQLCHNLISKIEQAQTSRMQVLALEQ
jgi:hypothetical protein